jgi:hypothetical protein
VGGPNSKSKGLAELNSLREKFLHLRVLLVHIPAVFNLSNLIVTSHSGLSYFVSLCTNLEELWILSWPRSGTERKWATTFKREEEDFLPVKNFPALHTFVLNVMEPAKIYLPQLVYFLVRNFEEGGSGRAPRQLWLDHPLLNLQFKECE